MNEGKWEKLAECIASHFIEYEHMSIEDYDNILKYWKINNKENKNER